MLGRLQEELVGGRMYGGGSYGLEFQLDSAHPFRHQVIKECSDGAKDEADHAIENWHDDSHGYAANCPKRIRDAGPSWSPSFR